MEKIEELKQKIYELEKEIIDEIFKIAEERGEPVMGCPSFSHAQFIEYYIGEEWVYTYSYSLDDGDMKICEDSMKEIKPTNKIPFLEVE